MATIALAADVVRIDEPTDNAQLPSNTEISFKYTVIGAQAAGITDAYYPNSMTVDFEWVQNGNESNVLRFNAASSLETASAPAGVSDKQYEATWKTPNCHFFTRYNPSDYTFSLLFTPVYPELTPNMTAPGPEQQAMSVPININVNNGTFPRC
ncbi:hypothetical protein K492DRAFT_196123 [Lichtheimia hyalospora FSU 10163]|nr:hypothetical protein K492DRAFT_196123 [Lichtheimia hyalospora FSU 10163]